MEEERFRKIFARIVNMNMEIYGRERAKLTIAFRRDFPEWHFSSGQFVGGSSIYRELREVWELSSKKQASEAKRHLQRTSMRFSRLLERVEKGGPSSYDWKRKRQALTLMVQALEWLQRRIKSPKVCENPKCATGNLYFFKASNNDRYCCIRCGALAKSLRKAKRDAESGKPPKLYKKPEETRAKMSISAILRHASDRASKGKN